MAYAQFYRHHYPSNICDYIVVLQGTISTLFYANLAKFNDEQTDTYGDKLNNYE
jgi:hypothetical protein